MFWVHSSKTRILAGASTGRRQEFAPQGDWGVAWAMGRKKQYCFKIRMVSGSVLSRQVKTSISDNALPIFAKFWKRVVRGCHGCHRGWTFCGCSAGMTSRNHPPPLLLPPLPLPPHSLAYKWTNLKMLKLFSVRRTKFPTLWWSSCMGTWQSLMSEMPQRATLISVPKQPRGLKITDTVGFFCCGLQGEHEALFSWLAGMVIPAAGGNHLPF